MKVISGLSTMNYVDDVCFSCTDSFCIVHSRANEFNRNLVLEFPKIMIRPPLIWRIHLTLRTNFRIMLCLMKSSGFVPLLNMQHKNL